MTLSHTYYVLLSSCFNGVKLAHYPRAKDLLHAASNLDWHIRRAATCTFQEIRVSDWSRAKWSVTLLMQVTMLPLRISYSRVNYGDNYPYAVDQSLLLQCMLLYVKVSLLLGRSVTISAILHSHWSITDDQRVIRYVMVSLLLGRPLALWPIQSWAYSRRNKKEANIFENHLSPVILGFIG